MTIIVGATLVHPDRPADRALERDRALVIEGTRIARIVPQAELKVPPGAHVIDASGKWVIPGLIDAHVHFFQSGNLYTRPDIADFNPVRPYAQERERNRERLPATFKVWLASGVTCPSRRQR